MQARTVRAHRSESSTGLALAATEDALRASYLLFASGYWEKNCGRPVLYFGSSRCAQPLPLRLYRPCRSSHSLHSPRLRPGKHCRPLQQHSMFRQNVQNSQNRFSSKAFGLSESILLILLILSEFATSRCLRARRPSLHSTMKKFLSVSLLSVLIAFGLQAAPESKTAKNPPPDQSSGVKSGEATSKPATDENAKPIDPSNVDPSVKPADDFFLYANGGWIKRTEIPPEYSRWGSFNQLIEHNNDAL